MLALTPLLDFGNLAEFEEEILTDREGVILGLSRGLRKHLRGFSLPNAIMVRNIFCLYTFLFDPGWQKAVKVVRRRYLHWEVAVDRIQDPNAEIRRLAAVEKDVSHNQREVRASELVDDIENLPRIPATVIVSTLLPEYERYHRAARLAGRRFGLSESQVTSYVERDRLPYWPTVSIRVEPLEIPTLRIDISESALAQRVLLFLLNEILPGDDSGTVARKMVANNLVGPVQDPRARARPMTPAMVARTWAIYLLSKDGGGKLSVSAAVDKYCRDVDDEIDPEHYRKQLKRLLRAKADFAEGIRRFRRVRMILESADAWKYDTYLPEIVL